ncbi:MAG: hypothetical protein KF684_09730 [Phycisphaeraceae bacterium]|nr:hypothetical protein [Phycisphaeraceae bacterium]
MLKNRTKTVLVLTVLAGAASGTALAGDPCPTWNRAYGVPGALGGSVSNAIVYNGQLFAGGGFTSLQGVSAGGVGRINLTTNAASNVGGMSIIDGFVSAFAVFNPGDGEKLYIGGAYNGIRINGIDVPDSKSLVSWDGSSIQTVPNTPYTSTFDFIQAMTVWNGKLVTGGTAGNDGLNQKPGLWLWDGANYEFYSQGWAGQVAPVILALESFQGDLYVAGRFDTYDSDLNDPNNPLVVSKHIMRFDGTDFHGVGGGVFRATSPVSQVLAMKAFDDGSGEKLFIGGRFDRFGASPGTPSFAVVRWDGTQFLETPGFAQAGREIRRFGVYNGELYAVGNFESTDAGGTMPMRKFAKWTGSGWEEVGDGFGAGAGTDNPNAIAVGEGRMFITGSFNSVGNGTGPGAGPVSNIAEWVGICSVDCPGDTNGDGVVNFSDLNVVLSQFGQTGAGLDGDLNDDGVVNFSDLNEVLSNFGSTCN